MHFSPRALICEVDLPTPLTDTWSTLLKTRLQWLGPDVTAVEIDECHVRVCGNSEALSAQLVRSEVLRVCALARRAPSRPVVEHIGALSRLSPAVVFQELRAHGDLIDYGQGRLGYTGHLLQVVQGLDERFRQLAHGLGAREFVYPGVLPLHTVHRAGYLAHFPHHVWLLAHFNQDIESIDALAGLAETTENISDLSPRLDDWLAEPSMVINPLICFHVYQQLADQPFTADSLLVFTASSHCMRFEPAVTGDLSRLSDFTMREVVFVGPAPEVACAREQLLQATCALAEQLDLTFIVQTAADPFFRVEDGATLGTLQRLSGLKYELLAELGPAEKLLALSSFNLHGNTFTRRFAIGSLGDELHTSCVGFGLERWALAFLCRYGLDVADWPEGWNK
jgi:seryl-tRNA synthetase